MNANRQSKYIVFLVLLNLIVCVTSSICKQVFEDYNQNYALTFNILIFMMMVYNAFYWSKKVNQQRLETLRTLLAEHQRMRDESLRMIMDGWQYVSISTSTGVNFNQKVDWKKEGF
jgi:hypothetical protein